LVWKSISVAAMVMTTLCSTMWPTDMAQAAYFEDGNDRESLNRLRNIRAIGGALTDEERALLQAADRVGAVIWPQCIHPETNQPVNGNAFLVRIEGRDAIVTNAHLIRNEEGVLHGNCVLKDYSNAQYWPNSTYFEQTGAAAISMQLMRLPVGASVDARLGGFRASYVMDDWIVLFLDEQISEKPAPHQDKARGFVRFADGGDFKTKGSRGSEPIWGFIIGKDRRQKPGVTTWQKCEFVVEASRTFHSCDTAPSSSGSLFGIYQDGEIRFQAINSRGQETLDNGYIQLPKDYSKWNFAISASLILREIEQITDLTIKPD